MKIRFHRLYIIFFLTAWICIAMTSGLAMAQSATVQGIITDRMSGEPLEGANVVLQEVGEERLRGMSADQNGFYQVAGLDPGDYALRISFIGYHTYHDTLSLGAGVTRTVSVEMERDEEQLGEVVVAPPGTGAAGISAGRQRVEAADFSRVPTPAAGGDLASYLQAMPGVVSTGDRGGHLYIRGGTPAENMVLVDGSLIFQPFHILGFFSAFPEALVSDADFYAGGYGARYSGRTSSVVDVKMRNGDRYETSASGSVSPFVAEVLAEGPLSYGNTSWIASVRRSFVEETSPWTLGQEYPLRFESQYLKLTHFGENDSRCSTMAMRTYDRGRLDVDQDDVVRWTNFVAGGRCVILPEGSNLLFDLNAGVSYVSNATGPAGDPDLTSDAMRVNLDVNLTRYFGEARLDYGVFVHVHSLNYDMSELFGGPQVDSEHLLSTGVYVETTFPLGNVQLIPGVVATYHKETYDPTLEPRLRATWQPWGRDAEQLSAAFGLYRQPLAGVTGTRDAGSVFTAWMSSPVRSEQIEAVHALLGWRQSLGGGFQLSAELYRKWLQHLPVPVWSHLVQFTTELALADGDVYGADVRLEFNSGRFYGFVGYGYGLTEYETTQEHFNEWFGESVRRYHPPHDRRHQVNSMASLDLGSYTAGVRWQLGSGLPFTRPMGFDELHSFRDKVPVVKHEYGTPRVILQDYYQGRMLTYHRLDISLERSIELSSATLNLRGGAVNLYDRTNMFYYDVYTHRRVDQLPFAPYFSVELELN
ncbi:MAG: TonB-dependent receptor [Balneolaceae bacterium]